MAADAPIESVIQGYAPAGDVAPSRDATADLVRSWVRHAAPGHRRRALQLLYAGAHLAAWGVDEHIPLRSDTLLRDTTIERFCSVVESDQRLAPSTRATLRSHLRCLARAESVPGNRPPTPPVARAATMAPYSSPEVAGYFVLARSQSRADRRQRLLALLCLGPGAGCASPDLRDLRGSDVHPHPDGSVSVAVRGPRPRDVTVLDAYASLLVQLAERAGSALMIGGVKPGRRAVTGLVLAHVEGGRDLPPLAASRLRSTWLVTHLRARTRLDVLMAAAGLTSMTSLQDLVHYLPDQEQSVAIEQLRAPCTGPKTPRLRPEAPT